MTRIYPPTRVGNFRTEPFSCRSPTHAHTQTLQALFTRSYLTHYLQTHQEATLTSAAASQLRLLRPATSICHRQLTTCCGRQPNLPPPQASSARSLQDERGEEDRCHTSFGELNFIKMFQNHLSFRPLHILKCRSYYEQMSRSENSLENSFSALKVS